MRRAIALLICIPLAVLGVLVAHQGSYLLVAPQEHSQLLADTGHGYLQHSMTVLSVLSAAVCVGILLSVVGNWRGRTAEAIPTWPFAMMGPAAFALQEHMERLLHDGMFPWTAALEPTFALGLLLQLPIALAAWLVAHLLLRVTRVLVGALARPGRLRVAPGHVGTPPVPRPAHAPPPGPGASQRRRRPSAARRSPSADRSSAALSG